MAEQFSLNNFYGFFTSISKRELPTRFNPGVYRSLNKDLLRLSTGELIAHYLEHGILEKRKFEYECPNDFHWENYLELNLNLKDHLTTEAEARSHWTLSGKHEGRKYS